MRAYFGLVMISLWGCGSSVVDVGTLPETGETEEQGDGSEREGSESESSGIPTAQNPDGSPCSISDLNRYRLVFDSDGGRLERRIYSMRADGSEIEAITATEELAREPAMSPDGNQLAYATPEGLKLLDMGSGNSELLVLDADQPEWAPDGSRIAYRGHSLGVGILPGLSWMEMPDRVPLDFFFCAENCEYPDFGVDADTLTMSRSLEAYAAVLTMDPVVGTLSFEVPDSTIIVTHPTVSGDGAWVAAAYDCPNSDHAALWVSRIGVPTPACEGRRISQPGAAAATNPEWGPGVLIAFERGEPPRDIGVVEADTGRECFIEGPGDDRNPSWVTSSFEQPE